MLYLLLLGQGLALLNSHYLDEPIMGIGYY